MKTDLMRTLLRKALDVDSMNEILNESLTAETRSVQDHARAVVEALNKSSEQSANRDEFLIWDELLGNLDNSAEILGFETGVDFACLLLGERPIFGVFKNPGVVEGILCDLR